MSPSYSALSATLRRCADRNGGEIRDRIASDLCKSPEFQRVCAGLAKKYQRDFGLSDTERQALIEELVSHIAWD